METFEDSKKLVKEKDLSESCNEMRLRELKTLKEEENSLEFSDNFQRSVLCVR